MTQVVSVSFGPGQDFEFKVHAADLEGCSKDEARRWFDREFVDLGCELPNPIGKVLLADLVLSVAGSAGARRFREQAPWATQFARNTAVLIDRSLIRVDVAGNAVGF